MRLSGGVPDPPSSADPPRLIVALPAGWTHWAEESWVRSLLAAGADALLVGFEAAADPSVAHAAISRLRSDPSEPLRVIVEHSPALAASVGAGVLLAERGVSTAEARRILGPGRLLGRVVGSPISAAAAAGADVLVVEGPPSEPASLRAIVEAAWAPVLASSQPTVPALVNLLPQFVRAGAEGIILRCEPDATPLMLVPLVSAARALLPPAWFDAGPTSKASAVVVVDGVAHPLPPETAVTDLLADLGRSNATAVALNGVTVARRRWDDTLLAADDDLRVIGS